MCEQCLNMVVKAMVALGKLRSGVIFTYCRECGDAIEVRLEGSNFTVPSHLSTEASRRFAEALDTEPVT